MVDWKIGLHFEIAFPNSPGGDKIETLKWKHLFVLFTIYWKFIFVSTFELFKPTFRLRIEIINTKEKCFK